MIRLILALFLLGLPVLSSGEPLKLAWDAVTEDTEGNPITGVKYKVYRSANGGAWKIVATREGTTYDWYFPVLGHYIYRVTAFNALGESLPSNELKVWIDSIPKLEEKQPAAKNEIGIFVDSRGKEE